MTTRTPDWLVERLHQGDLSPAEADAVRARLAEEAGLPRLAELARDDARFLEARPPGPALGEIRRRAAEHGSPATRSRRMFLVLAPLAATAVAVIALRLPALTTRSGDDGVRLKGMSPHLAIHRQRAGADPEALARGARVQQGDVLQLSIVSAGRPFGVVVSLDGRGVVTRHVPRRGSVPARLAARGAVALDDSYQLDDAPAFERFFLVTGDSPFAVELVLEAVGRLATEGEGRAGTPALPAGLAWSDFTLEKIP